MAVRNRTYAVALTIPDNEAFTALAALRRQGLPVGGVRRADIWTFAVDDAAADTLAETIATVEVIFNPNKHVLAERPGSQPAAGEVWIAPQDDAPVRSVGGRTIPGVSGVQRRTAWQLVDERGEVAASAVLDRAVETFLCNPAFQKAIRC
jgi:phosphoribosylformylglycinamidine (FGAM) synthase PurS component